MPKNRPFSSKFLFIFFPIISFFIGRVTNYTFYWFTLNGATLSTVSTPVLGDVSLRSRYRYHIVLEFGTRKHVVQHHRTQQISNKELPDTIQKFPEANTPKCSLFVSPFSLEQLEKYLQTILGITDIICEELNINLKTKMINLSTLP